MLKKALSETALSIKFLESLTGKLAWASAPFLGAAAFLSNLYKFIAVCNAQNKKWVTIPKNVMYDLRMWSWVMMGCPFIVHQRIKSSESNIMIRTDARSTPPSIGGWIGRANEYNIGNVSWFQFDIDLDLFDKICNIELDLERRISALELLGVLVAIRNWGHDIKNSQFRMTVHIETDSMVAKNSIHKWRAKTELMHTILRELIISVVQHNISLFASHVPGEQNDWADAISRKKPEYMCQLTPDKQNFDNNPNNVDFWLARGKFPWFRKQHSTKQYQVEKDIFFY